MSDDLTQRIREFGSQLISLGKHLNGLTRRDLDDATMLEIVEMLVETRGDFEKLITILPN